MANTEALVVAVLRLPPNERAAVAARILASLEEKQDEVVGKRVQGPSPKLSRLGRFLRGWGIPPVRLAHEVGFTRRNVRNLCEGKTVPTRVQATQLAAAMGRILARRVQPDELFDKMPTLRRARDQRS